MASSVCLSLCLRPRGTCLPGAGRSRLGHQSGSDIESETQVTFSSGLGTWWHLIRVSCRSYYGNW